MCPHVGYEADAGVEISPTGLTLVDGRCVHCVVSSSLSCLAFFWRWWNVQTLSRGHLCGPYFARLVCQILRFPRLWRQCWNLWGRLWRSLCSACTDLRSFFHHDWVCPPIFPPRLSSPYNSCLGIRESDIRRTWPAHRVCALRTGLWSRKSHHPTPTPGNFDYPTPTPTPTPTPDRLRPSAVLVT